MANALGELFGDIADAIRYQTGETGTMKPNEFPTKIKEIDTSGNSDYNLRLAEAMMTRDTKYFTNDKTTLSMRGFKMSDGNTLASLNAYSFAGFNDVVYMTFTDISMILTNAFADDSSLKILDITVPNNDVFNILATYDGAFSGCTALESVIIRDGGMGVAGAAIVANNGANDTFYVYVPTEYYNTIVSKLNDLHISADRYRKLEDYPAINFWDRTFTINFYDGEILIETKTVRYGETASITYNKPGYQLVGWSPEPINVTENMDCYGEWIPESLNDATWTQIATLADDGRISEFYNLGAEKEVTLSYTDGTTETVSLVIADFNNCELADGTIAAVTFISKHALLTKMKMATSMAGNYTNGLVDTYLNNDVYNALPEDLRGVIKSKNVNASTMFKTGRYCWVPNKYEMQFEEPGYLAVGQPLELFATAEKRIKTLGPNGASVEYWLRDLTNSGSYTYFKYVKTDGAMITTNGALANESKAIVFGVCL